MKNLPKVSRLLFCGLLFMLLSTTSSWAQDKTFTLAQAIDYALQNKGAVQNAKVDIEIAKARVGEVRAIGLPQVSAGVDYSNNLAIQRVFLPAAFLGDPTPGAVVAVPFGTKHSNSIALNGSQLLFDGSYLLGLKAAQVYTQLSEKALKQTEIQVADAVTRAYYSILITDARAALVDQNLIRLDSMLRETRILNKNGFVEKIDVDRLSVTRNNLQSERDKLRSLQELGVNLLKFQMGMPQTQPITLAGSIQEVIVASEHQTATSDYANRIEYSLLNTNQELATLNLRNSKAGYYPRLVLTGRYGGNTASDDFGDMFDKNSYFQFAGIGLGLQIPVFDGFAKKYKIQQNKLALQKIEVGRKDLEQAIDLQVVQANTSVKNARIQLDAQEENRELAQEVLRVARVKYREGVGSSIEVLNAETSLKEAETNYFSALYDLVISQVDLRLANGTLLTQ
ncbi:TolC family protein [Nibribacter ruber]|uniref:TolC family protein n=1 Tax=Nibribacter ruber TaxID=2698458 RepID=A0A6P1P2F7_9BACT|nr:TolC family protein [Nibribacter ruber]QHL88552.1 TolC family protein [Nibribacter ruber]